MLVRPGLGSWLTLLSCAAQRVWSQSAPSSNIDFSRLGSVAVAGNFDAISLYEYLGQREGFSSNGTGSLISASPSGTYDVLGSTDASIEAMCPFILKNGTFAGLIVAGNFTSIGGIDARSIALFNPTTHKFYANVGIQGSVTALLCDQDTETVYVGGSFEASISTNAITWTADGSWANLPFSGFDAPVNSITKAPNGHIVFGGSFTGLGNSSTAMTTTTTSQSQQGQVIPLSTANISSTSNTTGGGNIVCPSNSTNNNPWLLQDNTAGSWTASLRYGFEPTKLRLYNTHQDGRGTRTWRLTALPLNGIMNFTYTDPQTGNTAYCDATCPLSNNASLAYQDFYFVNTVGMNSFRLDVSAWYGAGGGLDGVEIFQNDIFAYAIDAVDEPTCTAGTNFLSVATTTGPWYQTPSRDSVADYLSVVVGPTTVNTTNIVFEPDVSETGNYSVIMYTPGCLQDSSCSARAIVNVTGSLTSGGDTTFNTPLYQTNNYDKYDRVYQGRIEAATSSFRPRVTISASGQQQDQLIVASRVRFSLISSTGGLKGLFDFDPNQAVVSTDFTTSAINNAGTMLRGNAQVNALTTQGDTIYSAGSFTDDTLENIMSFSNNTVKSLPNRGLNAAVSSLYGTTDLLYVAGNFTGTNDNGTSGLNNVAAYRSSNNSWVALGAGLNGPVDSIAPLPMNISAGSQEMTVAFSGSFTAILGSGSASDIAVNGLAIWVPSKSAWLETLNINRQFLAGQLNAYTTLPNGTWLGAGTLTSLGQTISGAAALRSSSNTPYIQELPINIESSSISSASTKKRALSDGQNVTGVVTGLFDNNNGRNVTIFGGHFTAAGNGSGAIQNLLFLNGGQNNAVSGLPTGIDTNSTFLSLALQNDLLFAGGSVSGEAGSTRVQGLVVYDMSQSAFRSTQPAALEGENVIVNSIVVQSGTTRVYVGGSFDSTAQGLACSTVCMYDTSANIWNVVGGELNGEVTALYWQDKKHLLAAGNLTVGGNSTSLAVYNTDAQAWATSSSSAIPGPVTAFAPGSSNRMYVAGTATNGSTYLMETDNNNFRPISNAFEANTTIRGLQVVRLTQNHGSSAYLSNNQALLVTGNLNLTSFGSASAALFNGTTFTPFILASSANGDPGSISQIFYSSSDPLGKDESHHSRGITILVAFCAALGTIFLIVLVGMILNRIQRKRAGYSAVPSVPYADKNSNINRVPPERLFGSLGQRQGAPVV